MNRQDRAKSQHFPSLRPVRDVDDPPVDRAIPPFVCATSTGAPPRSTRHTTHGAHKAAAKRARDS
jgi:hypothetical protein